MSSFLAPGFKADPVEEVQDIERVLPDWSLRWQEAFAVSRTFFDLPLERKNRIAMINSRHFRGYAANRQETTAGLPDWREQIDFGYVRMAVRPRVLDFDPTGVFLFRCATRSPESDPVIPYPPRPQDAIELSLYGPNLYPQEPSEFAVAIAQYRERVTRIAETLVRLIGEALSPSPELFSGLFLARDPSRHPPYARLKVVRYPPVAPDETGFGVGAHRDGGGESGVLSWHASMIQEAEELTTDRVIRAHIARARRQRRTAGSNVRRRLARRRADPACPRRQRRPGSRAHVCKRVPRDDSPRPQDGPSDAALVDPVLLLAAAHDPTRAARTRSVARRRARSGRTRR